MGHLLRRREHSYAYPWTTLVAYGGIATASWRSDDRGWRRGGRPARRAVAAHQPALQLDPSDRRPGFHRSGCGVGLGAQWASDLRDRDRCRSRLRPGSGRGPSYSAATFQASLNDHYHCQVSLTKSRSGPSRAPLRATTGVVAQPSERWVAELGLDLDASRSAGGELPLRNPSRE